MVLGLMIFTANVPRLRMNGRRQRCFNVGKIGGEIAATNWKFVNDSIPFEIRTR